MHAAVNNRSPEYINKLLVPVCTLPGRERLRSSTSGAFVVPVTMTQFGRRAFSVAGTAAWNELPTKLRCTTDIDHFKRALKAHLFSAPYVN